MTLAFIILAIWGSILIILFEYVQHKTNHRKNDKL
jgi:hypothetical protein